MARPVDLSEHSLDELSALIDEATNLRTTMYESRRRELVQELNDLEKRMGKKSVAGGTEVGNGLRAASGNELGNGRSPAPVTHVGPNGETWTNKGGIPKWAKALGVTDRAGMEIYRKK